MLDPETPVAFEVDVMNACHGLLAGHRRRVHVASSDFPRYDRNANSGGPIGADTELFTADQAVYHDAARPSHIVVSVVPRTAATGERRNG